ncbi:2-pyrone-4,6-dicarboxylate hydrolase [Rhodoplanes elegans]|uniref:2-pyrone-4,6-dicarboxylate hydrolase n=1 Tax=Rhodoplanes elegans TaxID=29408 RepID=A0A327JX72_9BRAD|nr:amidohydrolase family protein [Rhodoplanes elegans]MBK5959653.1 2-pyrone-4,6-dicarboxylate hydrolase [Rhodoplanes elegans]RAI31120.1 2-pyrone-4,6-dicarboxylate hydrolase [Rhodoplanes elegans]
MSPIPTIPPPHPDPHTPAFALPPLACDTHCHVFGPDAKYPYVADRPYTPPDAPLAKLQWLQERMGIGRAVLVNATPHGRDNLVVTDAIAASGGRYKGVANVDVSFSDVEIAKLSAAGIVGCRFTFLARLGGRPDLSTFETVVKRIAPHGWHVDLYLPAKDLDTFAPVLDALPITYVIDHIGVVDARLGVEQAAFRALVARYERDPKCWIKLTGAERVSSSGAPYHDVVPFAKRLIEVDPDRLLWGTDWPHPNVPAMPDDGDLVDLIPLYAPDPVVRQKLLVDNPARLFGFPA